MVKATRPSRRIIIYMNGELVADLARTSTGNLRLTYADE
jgi:hypothetical protein